MPQSKWERGFWASVRGSSSDFKPYPPSHWYKKKKTTQKKKNDFIKNHVKVLGIPDRKPAKYQKIIGKASNGAPVTILESVNHYVNNDDAELLLL